MSEQEIDYHSLPGLSHSRLKLLLKNPVLFKMKEEQGWQEDEKKYHVDGDMIDKMLLNYPKFQKKYLHQPVEAPTSTNQREFAHLIATGESIYNAYDASYAAKSEATIKRKSKELYNELKDYITFVRENLEDLEHKVIYNNTQQEMLMSIQQNALNHPAVSQLLDKGTDHVIIQNQLLGEDFKCEVDLLAVGKEVIWNIDLKSTGKQIVSFPYDYRRFGYQNQQAIYYKLIRTKYPNHRIRTGCIAVEKNFPYSVRFYEIHPRLLVQGWQWTRNAVDIYKFHKEHGFAHPPRTLEKGMELLTPYDLDESILAED